MNKCTLGIPVSKFLNDLPMFLILQFSCHIYIIYECFPYRYQDVCLSDFDFKQPENFLASSFLQIIWKDTTKFGIAKSFAVRRGLPQVFVVAVYRPPGNIKGFYHENISEGRFKKSYCKKVHSRSLILAKNSQVLTTTQIKSILNTRQNVDGTYEGGMIIYTKIFLSRYIITQSFNVCCPMTRIRYSLEA